MNVPKTTNYHGVLFALALGVLPGSTLYPLEFPGPNAPALLRLNSVRGTSFGQFIQEDQRQSLISRGGGVITLLASRGPSGSNFSVLAIRGLGTPEELATLGHALSEAKAGMQRDCILGGMDPGHIDITWFGRTGRQNTFTVALQGQEPPPETSCPIAIDRLVSAIDRYIFDSASHIPQD
jgi:hypothetical protein